MRTNTVASAVAYKSLVHPERTGITVLESEALPPSSSPKPLSRLRPATAASSSQHITLRAEVASMSSIFILIRTILQIFGIAPHLFLSIISHYQSSKSTARLSLQRMSKRLQGSRNSSQNVDREPDPEPPAAPPRIFILSQNSNPSGSQPQEQDPGPPHFPTSFPRYASPCFNDNFTPNKIPDVPLRRRHSKSQKTFRLQRLSSSRSLSLNRIQHHREYSLVCDATKT
ncbi:uncharacterized protein M421DRAFT_376596 [Didymella exigua CBS 183.55]|uniref:Uncharacterized protein n=1 Tax=Didymella exigua CBS 183.55 TaxID=1150837 RepID=A0A6A5RT54_9PLEO|nr:uncharacterized protein M421DRAFT_376596 [Didymella exigua CBS 183.55]KAF1930550.1 hypothetical protein M421DRAFT_376596 [Didymella exigua CBS 183.55]